MPTYKIEFKASDFQYPTSEEIQFAVKDYPKIRNFGFPGKEPLGKIMNGEITMEEAIIVDNLFCWDEILSNKLGKLNTAYINAYVNKSRGVSNPDIGDSKEMNLNGFQFDFYAETFYYFYFSTRDIISQIIKIVYKIDPENTKIYFEPLKVSLKEANHLEIFSTMKSFGKAIKKATNIRNSFTHGYTPNHPDHRSVLTRKNGYKTYRQGTGIYLNYDELFGDMNHSLQKLAEYILNLKPLLFNKLK